MNRLRAIASSWWFKLTLSVALLVFLSRKTDLGDLARVFAHTRAGWMLAAFFGYEISQIMSTLRWWMLGRPVGLVEPFGRYLVYYFSGMYLNLFGPSTVAGDVGRALYLAGGKGRRALALTSVIADRGIGFIALVWINAAAILLLPGYRLPRIMYLAAWLVPPVSAAAWFWGPRHVASYFSSESRWRQLVEHDLAPYWTDHGLLGLSFVLACLFHLVQIATQVLIAQALGLEIPWAYFLIFVPAVNIAGMAPISLSGIGIREAGYLYFLNRVGVDREAAIALGLLSSAVVLASGLSGMPAFLWFNPRRQVNTNTQDGDKAGAADSAVRR